jgi:hypothetical protein
MNVDIINFIREMLPNIKLEQGEAFSWAPEKELITYKKNSLNELGSQWALLHEAAHAKNGHTTYSSDIELLKLEVEAWEEARTLADSLGIAIDEDHIQDCLDTYRDWLHNRSSCPGCGVVCIQTTSIQYSCHNCHTEWTVSASRFCRPYRLTLKTIKEKRLPFKTATFS